MLHDELRAGAKRPLTRRQHECVALVTEGLSSKEIARQLGIAPSTVDNHIAQVMHQCGIPNRAALRTYNLAARPLVIGDDAPMGESRPHPDPDMAGTAPPDRQMSGARMAKVRNRYLGLALLIIVLALLTAYLMTFHRA